MDTLVVKIESTYISLAHVRKNGGRFLVLSMKKAPLPESLIGAEGGGNPDLIAAAVINTLQGGGFPVNTLSIYLGGETELFSEYRFSDALTDQARALRKEQAEAALLAGASAPLYRVKSYEYDGTDGGIAASAVLAADTAFCDRLRSALAKEGFTVTTISSSLVAFAETAGTVSGLGDRVIVLNAEKREMQAALFAGGRLARLSHIAKGTNAQDPVKPLLPYLINDTKVVLCGYEAGDERFRERLKQAGAADVLSIEPWMTAMPGKAPGSEMAAAPGKADAPPAAPAPGTASGSGRIGLSGELSYEDALFPRAFASAAFFGEEGASAYFSEARDVKKIGAGLLVAGIVTLVVAVFACVLPLATLAAAERDAEANRARLEDPFFADAAAKLDLYRALVSEYSELSEAEAAVPPRDPSHADMLEEAVTGLLADTYILEMYYEQGKGILIDFITTDAEAFDVQYAAAEKNREIFLYESRPRVEISEGRWQIQIRITHTPLARDGS